MDFSFPQVLEALAAADPDREAIVCRDRRLTCAAGHGAHAPARQPSPALARPRRAAPSAAGSPATSRARTTSRSTSTTATSTSRRMLGAFKARVAPFNVNYRYVAEELRLPARDAGARGARLPRRASRRRSPRCSPTLPEPRACCSRSTTTPATPLLPGARRLRGRARRGVARRRRRRAVARRPLHPLHRRHDRHAEGRAVAAGRHLRRRAWAAGVRTAASASASTSVVEQRRATARCTRRCRRRRSCTAPRTGSRSSRLHAGGTVVHPGRRQRLDPDDVWRTVEREQVQHRCTIVGDAFARPLLDQLGEGAATTCRALFADRLRRRAAARRRSRSALLEQLPGTS